MKTNNYYAAQQNNLKTLSDQVQLVTGYVKTVYFSSAKPTIEHLGVTLSYLKNIEKTIQTLPPVGIPPTVNNTDPNPKLVMELIEQYLKRNEPHHAIDQDDVAARERREANLDKHLGGLAHWLDVEIETPDTTPISFVRYCRGCNAVALLNLTGGFDKPIPAEFIDASIKFHAFMDAFLAQAE